MQNFLFFQGMCELNYEDVRKCLNMDFQEKLARAAGKQLFYRYDNGDSNEIINLLHSLFHFSLNKGNNFVSQYQLNCKIREIIYETDEKKNSFYDKQVRSIERDF